MREKYINVLEQTTEEQWNSRYARKLTEEEYEYIMNYLQRLGDIAVGEHELRSQDI